MSIEAMVTRAMEALREAQRPKTQTVYVAALDAELTFSGVDGDRRSEIYEAAHGDARAWVKKLLLNSCTELRELAVKAAGAGAIKEYEDICALFSEEEISRLTALIDELSDNGRGIGIGGRAALKN